MKVTVFKKHLKDGLTITALYQNKVDDFGNCLYELLFSQQKIL
jgi:hypothetical protein